MAVFEVMERYLVAKQQAFLMENSNNNRTSQLNSKYKIDRDNQSSANHCGFPYSSFVSDLHEHDKLWR